MKILKWLGRLFLPMFSRPKLSPGLIWAVHLLLIAAVTVGLWFVHRHFELSRYVGGRLDWLRDIWLPVLFLLAYFVLWQAWWVWKLLQPESIESVFPDLDEAWSRVVESLNKAGIGIGDTPVFLVFGRVSGADEAIFQGVPGGLAVTGATPSGSPIRAFANRDGIYITCPGASLLGGSAGVSAAPSSTDSVRAGMDLGASIGIGGGSIGMSASMGGDFARVQQIIRAARDQNRSLTEAEKQQVYQLSGSASTPTPAEATPATLIQNPAEVDYRLARLSHVCSLIARTRWPLCPINGSIVYIRVDDCEREDVAQQIGLIARQDLRTAEQSLRLHFPVYALLGGIESLPGAGEFLARFAVDRQSQRLGRGFPLAADVPAAAAAAQAEESARWVFHSLLPYWVFKLFQVERGAESPAATTRTNTELFHFLDAVRTRGSAAARLVGRLAAGEGSPMPFGGCYLTANAPELGGPLFVDEFFKKVHGTQGYVAWTDAAFADEARCKRLTKIGYAALGVLVVAVLAFMAYVLFGIANHR
jgi:hypothetical protein